MEIEQKFTELCRETVEKAGYNLGRVSWREKELCLYIDKNGGADLDDCEAVTKAVEPIIEANDTILGENYSLSVSSMGIDGKDWEEVIQ
jgi:ribosome maturation factor RimP